MLCKGALFPTCLLVCVSIGCTSAARPTAPVTGQVTYQGQPLKLGKVVFMHVAGPTVVGQIDKNGRYQFRATVGPNRVAIQSRDPELYNPGPPGNLKMWPGPSLIPERYGDFGISGLTFDVQPENNTADFDLKE